MEFEEGQKYVKVQNCHRVQGFQRFSRRPKNSSPLGRVVNVLGSFGHKKQRKQAKGKEKEAKDALWTSQEGEFNPPEGGTALEYPLSQIKVCRVCGDSGVFLSFLVGAEEEEVRGVIKINRK